MHRRTLLGTAASIGLTALAGCTGEQTPRPERVSLRIDTEGSWSGATSTDDGSRSIEGRGDDTLEWTQPLPSNVRVTLRKGPQQGVPLEATFYADDEEIRSTSTSEPYDSISITHVPGTN